MIYKQILLKRSASADLLNSGNSYFEAKSQTLFYWNVLKKTNSTDTEAAFVDLHLSMSSGFVSSNIYDKRVYFDFVISPFLDGDSPRALSNGV